jgi:hypothetical protein
MTSLLMPNLRICRTGLPEEGSQDRKASAAQYIRASMTWAEARFMANIRVFARQ